MDRSDHQVSPGKPSCENELANRNLMESEDQKRALSHLKCLWRRVPGKTSQLTHPQQEDDQQGKIVSDGPGPERCTLHGSWRKPTPLATEPARTHHHPEFLLSSNRHVFRQPLLTSSFFSIKKDISFCWERMEKGLCEMRKKTVFYWFLHSGIFVVFSFSDLIACSLRGKPWLSSLSMCL